MRVALWQKLCTYKIVQLSNLMTSTANSNLLTVSEMERKELLALIVFLERVPCLLCSLFAEILVSSFYYSLRTPVLHLLCVNRRHLLLRAFRYALFFGGGGLLCVRIWVCCPFCPNREIVSVVLSFVHGSGWRLSPF